MAHEIGHGASGTTSQGLGQNGALRNILTQTSGSGANADNAIAFANQFSPLAPKADPWEAAFQFFAEMGKQASVPGSTALGAGVSSLQVPMNYLNAKKKERRDSEAARTQMALTIGAGLKGPTGSAVKVIGPDGEPIFMSTEEAIRTNAVPYFEPKSGSKSSLTTQDYIVTAEAGITIGDKLFPQDSKIQLTDQQRALFGPADLYTAPTGGGDSGSQAATAFSKMYDDLGTAEDEAKANALQFLVDNPLATPEDIVAAAEADSAVQEANTLQKQIDTAALAAGFNKEIFAGERDIRKEWNNFKKPFNKIQIGYQKLVKSLESVSGPGDMAAVFGFMKLLDPGSVVRESEFSAAQNTSGLMDRIYLQKSKLVEGELLTPKQRDEFMKLATEFYNLTSVQFGDARLDLGQVVKNNSVFKVENIFGSEEGPPSWYLDSQNYSDANDLDITAEALWLQLTPAEQEAWIEANGDS